MVPIISPLLSVRKDPSKAAATFSQNPAQPQAKLLDEIRDGLLYPRLFFVLQAITMHEKVSPPWLRHRKALTEAHPCKEGT